MNCWVCGGPANGVCRFCGRAICRQDAETKAFVLEVYQSNSRLLGLAVGDALYCGVCEPKPEPVAMDFLASQDKGGSPPKQRVRKKAVMNDTGGE